MNYLDFTLQLTLVAGAKCRVSVHSPRGEVEQDICLPFEPEELAALRASLHQEALWRAHAARAAGRRQGGAAGRRDMVVERGPAINVDDFGKKLHEAVFQAPVAALFAASVESAGQTKQRLRVKLMTPNPWLALVPWELFCTRPGHHLSLSEQTPLVRHVLVDKPPRPLLTTPPLRVLGVLSNGGGAALDLEGERAQIDAELVPLVRASLAEVEWLENPTKRDLFEALNRREWHILHFAGHGSFDVGSAQGVLAMSADDGGHAHLRANELRVLLRDRTSVRLVFLNSCDGAVGNAHELFSSTAAIVAEAGVPAVLAMQFPIADEVATAFARHFYHHLAAGMSVEGAVTAARKYIKVCHASPLEWATPVLFTRVAGGALVQPPSRLCEPDNRPELRDATASAVGSSPGVEGTLVPITREGPEPTFLSRNDVASALPLSSSPLSASPSSTSMPSALPLSSSPLALPRHPFVAAALGSTLVVLGLLVVSGERRFFEPPPAAPPADVRALAPLPVSAPLPASARPGALGLVPPDASRVSQGAGELVQGAGQLVAQTTEPSAALTLSLDDGQRVTPNVVTSVNPGRRTLTVSKGGRELRSLIVQVSPGVVTTANVTPTSPAPRGAPAHGAKVCDKSLNCISH